MYRNMVQTMVVLLQMFPPAFVPSRRLQEESPYVSEREIFDLSRNRLCRSHLR